MQHLDELDDTDLADLYAYPPPGERGYLRANFISTLDGSATGEDGRTGSINDAADQRVFAMLRALADVVLVGAGTARDEGYRRDHTPTGWQELRAGLGLSRHPALAVVSRSLDLPEALLAAADDSGRLLVVATQDADPQRLAAVTARLGAPNVLLAGRGSVDLVSVVERLAGQGLTRILLEGGPQLMNDAARADLVDELCLTLAPVLVGGNGPRIGAGAPTSTSLRLAHALRSDSCLLTRWVRP